MEVQGMCHQEKPGRPPPAFIAKAPHPPVTPSYHFLAKRLHKRPASRLRGLLPFHAFADALPGKRGRRRHGKGEALHQGKEKGLIHFCLPPVAVCSLRDTPSTVEGPADSLDPDLDRCMQSSSDPIG